MQVKGKHYRAVWMKDRSVYMIDQRLLPHEFKILECKSHRDTAEAICDMAVRGAGSIGAAAGFGSAQVVLEATAQNYDHYLADGFARIRATRPTAHDLFYAVDQVEGVVARTEEMDFAKVLAVKAAHAISDHYARAGEAIGRCGARLLKDGSRVLTHCNAGWIALQDWGSALAPVYYAKREGKKVFVYADETRPRLQGMKLTSWELSEEEVDHAIIPDNAAGYYMRKKMVDIVIVGADRIACNGDAANKIGTYEKAVLAKENDIPFYVAAPLSTFDLKCPTGDEIPIEERSPEEVLFATGLDSSGKPVRVRLAPRDARALNPAFDVTPARYITGIITPRGIIKPHEVLSLETLHC